MASVKIEIITKKTIWDKIRFYLGFPNKKVIPLTSSVKEIEITFGRNCNKYSDKVTKLKFLK